MLEQFMMLIGAYREELLLELRVNNGLVDVARKIKEIKSDSQQSKVERKAKVKEELKLVKDRL